MPFASQASMVFRSRMPPPSCTGMVTAFSIAIDLKNGQCVRLEQGDMTRATCSTSTGKRRPAPSPRRA